MDELLYTQEDINEWIRTCEALQEKIKEQEETIEELSEYKRLKEQGLLVRLPCKVGDKIFYINKYTEPARIEEFEVHKVVTGSTEDFEFHFVLNGRDEFLFYSRTTDDVFFTREEAEKKLEELKEKKND